jgi:hypothetical protein
MSKTPRKGLKLPDSKHNLARRDAADSASQDDFDEVLGLIDAARTQAVVAVNTSLIDLYWRIGEYIARKIIDEGWGQGTVESLAEHIQRHEPNARGFSARNLWRMMQFVETYRGQPELAPLVRGLPWSHNLAIMSRCKRDESSTSVCQTRSVGLSVISNVSWPGHCSNEPFCRR